MVETLGLGSRWWEFESLHGHHIRALSLAVERHVDIVEAAGSIPAVRTMEFNMEEELEKKEFNEAFWKWFDSLSVKEKEQFWNYTSDMAKVFFYNKYWIKWLRSSAV